MPTTHRTDTLNREALAHELENELLSTIPLTRTMQIRVLDYDGTTLRLAAPLEPNINDKGCAFGGSLASVMTLACWGLARSALAESGHEADIYVQDSHVEYLAPVWTEIVACAEPAAGKSLADFVTMFRTRGKARISLTARVDNLGVEATRLSARFVAKKREEKCA